MLCHDWDDFLHFIIAMIATLAFAVLFQAPKSEWGLCGLTGGVGWFVYEYLHLQQGWHLMLATIVATLALTLLSRLLQYFASIRQRYICCQGYSRWCREPGYTMQPFI